MSALSDTVKELLAKTRTGDEASLYSVDEGKVKEIYLDNLPQTLKDIGFNEEHMETYGQYNRDFGEEYYRTHATGLAKYVKGNEEINTHSISTRLPGGVELGIDFARPTGDNVTKDEWAGSFGMRNSIQTNEGLANSLREEIGNLFE